jgi:hypothetical protein
MFGQKFTEAIVIVCAQAKPPILKQKNCNKNDESCYEVDLLQRIFISSSKKENFDSLKSENFDSLKKQILTV